MIPSDQIVPKMSSQSTPIQELRKLVHRSIQKLVEILTTIDSSDTLCLIQLSEKYTDSFIN